MNIDSLRSELVKENILSEIIYFDEIDSTNLYCKRTELQDNTLILTSFQKNGIGRFGRKWESTPGENLTFSLVKYFKIDNSKIHLVNFYSSFILFDTFKKNYSDTGVNISLKWPNDLLIGNKKTAGFLLDVSELNREIKKFIIGIGINVNQKVFSDSITEKATSLYIEIGQKQNSLMLLTHYIKNFYSNLSLIENGEELIKIWKSATDMIYKKIIFRLIDDKKEFSATVVDVDNDGGLKLKTSDGIVKKYFSGEMSIVN